MNTRHLKIASITTLALAFTAGSAFAGNGKDCDKKHKMKTEASSAQQTSVMGATAVKAEKKARKVLSFEDATKLCVDKGATDLQSCIDYKTGVTDTYKGKAKPKARPHQPPSERPAFRHAGFFVLATSLSSRP